MKKILLEYVNVFAYTIIGLIFGLAFFLLFLNFYHMQELDAKVDVTSYNENNRVKVEEKIATIKNNINVYNQSTYNGTLNIYGLNTVQIKLQNCLEILESDEVMKYFKLDKIGVKDSYNFSIDFKNRILNDCLVMQIKSIFNTDTVASLPNFSIIRPFVELDIDTLLGTTDYVQFFDLAEDSYADVMNSYQSSLDLMVEVSNWYKNVVIGG